MILVNRISYPLTDFRVLFKLTSDEFKLLETAFKSREFNFFANNCNSFTISVFLTKGITAISLYMLYLSRHLL